MDAYLTARSAKLTLTHTHTKKNPLCAGIYSLHVSAHYVSHIYSHATYTLSLYHSLTVHPLLSCV